MTDLYWLPQIEDWRGRLRALRGGEGGFDEAVALANARLEFVQTGALDGTVRQRFGDGPPAGLATEPVRLAVLGSSMTTHLLPGIRVAGLRCGLWVETYETAFGRYWQELTDEGSGLHAFRPTAVLFALDGYHLTAGIDAALDSEAAAAAAEAMAARLAECWRLAREAFHCPVSQQTALPVHPPLFGSNEHRLPGSRHAFLARFNAMLRASADMAGVDILALDARAAQDGLAAWHDPALWHHAKQEVSPKAAPLYGHLVVRLLAARLGRSYKCLVLDLDETLWGGVVGDDGLSGLVLGQGSASGEAFVAFQHYVRELSRRGVILAVCSKNDEANAWEPFDRHPEMVLKRADIASFVANWGDKPANLKRIAEELNIGIDSLVFVDDNPFERALVRRELPMVAVPDMPDDPALFARALADAGYFEAITTTGEDRARSRHYQSNRARESLRASATDLDSYLKHLEMQLQWRPFDEVGLQRTVQLINKTNQFNLTTRRYTEDDVLAVMRDPRAFGLQLRLIDRFGDNGIIAVVIGRLEGEDDAVIDTWLMSCRVLGRGVEPATLNLVAQAARRLGARRLVGRYIPTKKNGMVKDLYEKLGFTVLGAAADGGNGSTLDLVGYVPAATFIDVVEI